MTFVLEVIDFYSTLISSIALIAFYAYTLY